MRKFSLINLCLFFFASAAFAQDEPFPILFTNVNVFDGVNGELIENASVLVNGNLIAEV